MTLDQAIQHSKEAAETNTGTCAEEHLQLVEWLEELKMYREKETLEMETTCVICESKEDLSPIKDKQICRACIEGLRKLPSNIENSDNKTIE